MTSIMHRSFAEHMGVKWPKDWAMKIDGVPVTWTEIHAKRTAWQQERLRRKRDWFTTERRAAYVWVFYQPGLFGFAYMGWWLYLRTIKDSYALDFRGLHKDLILQIMRQFPCGILPAPENFKLWKQAFAKEYSRPGRFKKQGLAIGWVDIDSYGHPERFTAVQQ